MSNYLKNQTSPYLLQHADNPVNWYPWCSEAFEKAKKEDKPIFLSIGYSTCHWCHVMAHESFEDEEVAVILNDNFISIKVDKEERPDIDSIYMSVCQTLTGSGGWPTTIVMTPEQKPFFAGTYFPKHTVNGHMGLIEILMKISERWQTSREKLTKSAEDIISFINNASEGQSYSDSKESLIKDAVERYEEMFDEKYGGFGSAPKFPTPHNLIFLMRHYEKSGDKHALLMAEKTLTQLYRGGIFDHVGGGFSRYSTDQFFLVPHFEKMLYDNALLIMAYSKAYELTKKRIYRYAAQQAADYVLREMTAPEGGFYSAQDADSEGEEGKYYLFTISEIMETLGEGDGEKFCKVFDITERGNFERRNIPNLLKSGKEGVDFQESKAKLYEYRRSRYSLNLDDKVLTSWNALMITAMCWLYRITGNGKYIDAALKAQQFIDAAMWEDEHLCISWRENKSAGRGLLDDYAYEIFGLIALYEATLDSQWLDKAKLLAEKVAEEFYDDKKSGYFMYGDSHEQLILRPKETYDGAIFSGNSAMAYNLVRLWFITNDEKYGKAAQKQLEFMSGQAKHHPAGYSMFLLALSDFVDMPEKITVVLKGDEMDSEKKEIVTKMMLNAIVQVIDKPTEDYPLKNEKTTFYICKDKACHPPVNELNR